MLWTILLSTSSSDSISSWSKTSRGTKLSSCQRVSGANLWRILMRSPKINWDMRILWRRACSLALKLYELLEWKTQGGQWVFWRWGVTRLLWKNASGVCTMCFVSFDALLKSGASSRSPLHWDESQCLQFECRALISGGGAPEIHVSRLFSQHAQSRKPIASKHTLMLLKWSRRHWLKMLSPAVTKRGGNNGSGGNTIDWKARNAGQFGIGWIRWWLFDLDEEDVVVDSARGAVTGREQACETALIPWLLVGFTELGPRI